MWLITLTYTDEPLHQQGRPSVPGVLCRNAIRKNLKSNSVCLHSSSGLLYCWFKRQKMLQTPCATNAPKICLKKKNKKPIFPNTDKCNSASILIHRLLMLLCRQHNFVQVQRYFLLALNGRVSYPRPLCLRGEEDQTSD